MIETPRLRLRRWRDEDRAPFAALNADEAVGYWIAGPVSRAESDAQIDRFEAHAEGHGFTSWAVADRQSDQLIGMCGLRHLHGMPFGDAVEAAWRWRGLTGGKAMSPRPPPPPWKTAGDGVLCESSPSPPYLTCAPRA